MVIDQGKTICGRIVTRRVWTALLVFSLITLVFGVNGVSLQMTTVSASVDPVPDRAPIPQLAQAYGQLPMTFEANRGQTHSDVNFLARGGGYTLFLTGDQALFSLRQAVEVEVSSPARDRETPEVRYESLAMALVGSNPHPQVNGENLQPGISNYFLGSDPAKWVTDVPHYGQVRYQDVYPGIDLLYYGNQQQLQYDFILAPGADPGLIRLDFAPAEQLELDANGDLLIHMAGGVVRQQAPFTYQDIGGERIEVTSRFVLLDDQQVGFEIGDYDPAVPLVIDPTLVYSTFLGGSDDDYGYSIAVDGSGAAYVTGYTYSTNFPTLNPSQATNQGEFHIDGFVTKLAPAGNSLIYSTYLGGSDADVGTSIAVDGSGATYVTGFTLSADFPTLNPYQTMFGGYEDGFVTKLAPAGNSLVYSTYLGGERR